MIQLLDYDGLAEQGIKKSPSQHHRNVKDGKFPAPIKLGGRNAYVADEIEAYKRAEMAKRDHPSLREDLEAWIRKQLKAGVNPWAEGRIDAWVKARLDANPARQIGGRQ